MLKLGMVPASKIQATSALKRTILIGAPFCVAVFVITNPHGLLGGYFFLLGLAVLWPVYFVAKALSIFSDPTPMKWTIAIAAQFAWTFVFFYCFGLAVDRIRNRRHRRS